MKDKDYDILNDPQILKWVVGGFCGLFMVVAISGMFSTKFKTEGATNVTEAWSKVIVACIESGDTECDKKYKAEFRL